MRCHVGVVFHGVPLHDDLMLTWVPPPPPQLACSPSLPGSHAHFCQIQEESFALKTVLQYYGYWEPPPVLKDAVMFYERVLLPKVSLDELKDSITLRGRS